MAPSKKKDGRKKRNSKSASDNNNVSTNTRRRSSSRSSSRKNSCDSGKNIPASDISIKNKSKDHSSGDLEADCENVQEKSSQDDSNIDIYGDLADEIDDDGEKEPNGKYEPNSFESDFQKDIYHMEEKSNTPIKDKTVVASKKLEDKINTKKKDIQSNSEMIQETASKRKSNKDEVLDQANLDLYDDLIISRKNKVSSKEVLELKNELERVNVELYKSREHCAKLEEDNEQLLKNTSSLWKTALAQIRGKIAEISTLKREKEQIIFRRAMRQVGRDDLDRAVSRIAAYNKDEFAEFIEGMKKEPSCSCGGAGAQTNNPGQNHSTLLNKNIQEKVLGNRVCVNDDRDTLMLQKHLGKAGEKISLRPDLQQKQKHVGTNRQHINKKKEGFNKKQEVISKKNIDENEKVPEQGITRERATKNRLTKASERYDRYGEEVGEKRLEGHEHRSIWREDGDEGRHNTRSNIRDESRKNEFHFESGDERYDSRRIRSAHCKEGSGTNESDGDLLNDRRSVRKRNSRLDSERNLSDDEVYSSRIRTRSKDKKDLKKRIDRSEKNELIDEEKRSKSKRKRSESPDKDIRIKRESRRNKSNDAKQRESNPRMSVFERLGRNKAEKSKADDITMENHLHDQRKEDSDKFVENGLSDSNNILKKFTSDDGTDKGVETLNEDYPSKTQDQISKDEEAEEMNVDINSSFAHKDYDQMAENVQYDNDYDHENINSQSFVAEDAEEDNMNSIKVSKKKPNLGSFNDDGMPNTLFAQRMKDRLAGKSPKTVARPKSQISSKVTQKTDVQCSLDTKAVVDVYLPGILQNLVPSINSCEFKSEEANSSYNSKSEEPKIKKDVNHPVSGNEDIIIHENDKSALKETNSNMNNNSTNSKKDERCMLNTSLEGQHPKSFESSGKKSKGKETLKGCLKDLLLTLKKSNNTISHESKNNLECKDKFAYNEKTAEREETDTVSDADNALEMCEPINLDNRTSCGSEAVSLSEYKDKVANNDATVESEEEESASDVESGLEIDETLNLDDASSHGSKTLSLVQGKDNVASNDKTVERKENAVYDIRNTLETEHSISLQLNDEPINLDNVTSRVSENPLEDKVANIDKTAERKENETVSDKKYNLEAEQTNSLCVNDCPGNLDNDFDGLEDILSDMGLKVSPKHDSTALPFVPLENDKDIKMNLPVEDKANSILMSPYEDKASSNMSSPVEDSGRSILTASVDEMGNKEISGSHKVKSLDKVLDLKINIESKFTVEEKDCNNPVADDKDNITKDADKIPKKSFRIPKLKKTPSKTEVDRMHTSTNTLGQPRRSKRTSTEGIMSGDEFLDKTESTIRKTDSFKTESPVRKADSFTCSEVLKQKESQMDSEKKSTDSLTSSEVQKHKESQMVVKSKSKGVPNQVVNKSIQIQSSAKSIKNRIESNSCSDEQESNNSSDEQVIRSKVRKSKTQRSKIRRLRIESDSSSDEKEIKKDTMKSPTIKTQTKDKPTEYPSLTETSPNKSQTDNYCSDKSPTSDGKNEAVTVNTPFLQHFKRRVKKKHNSVVLTAVSSTVVNCSPNKNYTENITASNSKEIGETHGVKSLDKDLELKANFENKSIFKEKDCKKQIQDKKSITKVVDKIPSSEDNIPMDKNKYKIPKIKNTISITKEVDRIQTSTNNIKRGSVELKDTMNILRNIVARNIPKQISENLETKDRSEKMSKCLKESNVSDDIDSKVYDMPMCGMFLTDTKNKSDKHTKIENKSDKDTHKKDRKISDTESKVDKLKCDMFQTDNKNKSDKHIKKENKSDKDILKKDRKISDDIESNIDDTKHKSDKHTKKEIKSDKDIPKKDRKSKRMSLLFDENVRENGKLSSEEESKKSICLNNEKEKKHMKGSKHLNVKVAKKISSLFDEEIPALTDSNTGKAILIDSLTDERQNEVAIFSSASYITNSNNMNENLSEIGEATEDKNDLKNTKSQRIFEPKSNSSVEEKFKNLDTEVLKEVIDSVTENNRSPITKMGDDKDEVSFPKEHDSPVMTVTKDLIMSETDSSKNIVTLEMNKDVFETPKIVNHAGKDAFNEIISPRTEKHSNIHNECSDKNTSSEESKCLDDRHTSSNESECLEDDISFTKPECLEANSISSKESEYLENKAVSSKDPEYLEDIISSKDTESLENKGISSKDPAYLEDDLSSKDSEILENRGLPSEEPECVENKNLSCLEPVHNEDFLELFATESLAGDTDIEDSPVKKQSNKAKDIKIANTNVDKWKQSFSGKNEMETTKSNDKIISFIKFDCKSAFGIKERKIREPEIETKMSRKVIKEKGKKTEIIESESLKDNAIDKKSASKSWKANEKSNDKANAVCRRSPRKHQNPQKNDDGDSWFPSEEELLFDESDSSIEGKELVTDVSRNLFDEKSLNSKNGGEYLSNEINENDKTKEKSNTVTSVNNKENTKERNHKPLTKSVSEKIDTRRTSSRHKDGPLTMRERRGRSSPSRERRSDRKLRSPVRSPNRKLRSPVRSPNRKLRSPGRSPNRKLRSPGRSPDRKLRSPGRSPDRKLRSPLRSPEKYPNQSVLTSPRQKRESPKGRSSPRSKHLYESNISPKGRPSPKRKETDYRGRERHRREDRRQDSMTINTRERSTRSRKESTHDERRVNTRDERKVSTHDEIIDDFGSNRNSDTRRTRHSSGDEKRSKEDRKRLDYKDKQRDRDERSKEIRGRSDERPRRRERELKQNINVGDRKTEEKLSVGDDKQEETISVEDDKTEEKTSEVNVSEPKLVEYVPISKAPVNPELIKKFTEDRSSDREEGELDDEEEGEIRESENDEETEEHFNEVEKDTTLNKRSRSSNKLDTKKEELVTDAKFRDCKTKNKDDKTKNEDNLHKEQTYEIYNEKRISRKEDKKQEFNRNKEEMRESKNRKETEELIDKVGKDEYVNKRKKCNEIDREKLRIPSDTKYRDRKMKDEEEKNKNCLNNEKYEKHTKENKSSRREPPQEFYKNKDMEKSRETDAKPLQHKRSPTRSERPLRRITPIRIGNTREVESRHCLRSGSPRKSEHSRRSDQEKSEESHEKESRGRVITDRREGTPLIDHSRRPLRRIKPITIESEPDPSTLFRVTQISEPKENYFNKFMNSIGQIYSDSNACETKDKSNKIMPMNACDDSEMSLLQYIGKDQQETTKSLEMECVDETDACQIMQDKIYAENTVTMVQTYKLEEIEKFLCKDNLKKSPFDLQKLHPLDPRLKLLSKNRTSEVVTDEKVESRPVDDNKDQNTAIQEEDISSSIDLCKQLELSSDVTNQDSNSNSMDVFGKSWNPIKVMNTTSECSKETAEPAKDEKNGSDSDDSSSSDSSTTEDSSSCPAAPSSSSRSSNFISSSSRSSHINSISKSPKTVNTPTSATKRLNFGDFKIPKSLSDDNSVLPDVVFPLKSGNNPIAVQFGNHVSTLNQDSTDISSQDKKIENPSSELSNNSLEMEQVITVAEISQTETTEEIRIPKIIEDITEETAQQTSPNKTETTGKNPNLETDIEQMNTDNVQLEQVEDDLTTAQDKSEHADETMVMEDLHLESDSDSNNSDHSNCQCSKCGNSSSSSGSSSSSSDSDTSSDSEGEKDGGVASDPTKSPLSAVRRSSRNSSLKSTPQAKKSRNKSPTKSPAKSTSKSPIKLPIKSPAKSTSKSPIKSSTKSSFKSPSKSPSKSYLSPPLTPRTPKTSNISKDPVVNVSPSMPRLFDSTPKKSPKKHNISYKKTPSPKKKVHKSKTPKKSLETSKSPTKMTEHILEKVVSKSPCKKLLALKKSPRKSPRKSLSKIMSPEKSPCKLTSPKTPGKSPCKSSRSPCKKILHKSPHKSNNTPCKFASPVKSPWKISSPRTPGKDLMASMMSPPLGAFTSPGKTISHLWKSPKKIIRKNEPLLLNDQVNYLPFQSPPGEQCVDLIDEDIYNSPVLKKDENIAVKEDELNLLLDLENLATEAERDENEENVPNKSLDTTSGEDDSVLSALALSPEETPVRPHVSKQENITPKSVTEVGFRKERLAKVDVTPKVCDVLSSLKTNGASEIIEHFPITPRVNLELQATSTPKLSSTESPKTGRSKLLQHEIHVTPITIDYDSTPKSNCSETTVKSNKTLMEALQETPKSHKMSADNSKELGLEGLSQRSFNETPKNNSDEKPNNNSIVGVSALHINSEENKGNKSNNVSSGSKEPSPGSPRRIRAYVTASGQLRVPRRRPNFGVSNSMPALSCSQPIMNSVSIVHTDEKTLINKTNHKKQLFPTRENGPTKRALSPSVSPMAETENMPDKRIKIMSPRSYHQNVAIRSLVTEGSTQQVTKKLLSGDSSSNLPNENTEASKKSITSSTVAQPLSLIGSNQTVIVRRKKRKRDFNPTKT